MSFTAKFWRLSKRINSTLQPVGAGTSYDIILKDGCSLLNPAITLKLTQDENPTGFNYCYIQEFARYYFVGDWYWDNRQWTAELTADPMASWKSSIGGYTAYVRRSASNYDGDIMDMYYPALAKVTETKNAATTDPGWSREVSSGKFVIGVMGKSAGQNGGAVTYYVVTPSAMQTICNYLLNVANLGTIDDISEDLLKCIFNPLQYIVSCLWFPFDMTATNASSVNTIHVGWWDVSVSAHVITAPAYTRNLSFTVPKHPQQARGNYLNMPPFTSYFINAGPWGVIPINNIDVLDETSLSCEMYVDLYTGSGRLSIVTKDVIAVCEDHVAQIGVPIQLGQNVLNQGAIANAAGGAVNAVQSALTGNVSGMLGGGMQSIMSAAEVSQSVPSTIGSNGSFAFSTIFCIVGRFLKVADEDLASRGRPLCADRQLSNLSGYIECIDADPAIDCTPGELETIVNYLNNGFYYE